MKFSKSRDSLYRVTVRVDHRLDRDDLVNALACEVESTEVLEYLPPLMSVEEIMKRVRNAVRDAGDDAIGARTKDKYLKWAERQIDVRFF